MKRLIAIVSVALLGVGLVACEKSQVITYKQGKYQGKTDSQPWENEQFKGDKVAWEKAMKQRASNQNEYRKIP